MQFKDIKIGGTFSFECSLMVRIPDYDRETAWGTITYNTIDLLEQDLTIMDDEDVVANTKAKDWNFK